MYGYVYKLTYLPNGKIYIGAKTGNKVNRSYYGSGTKWNKEVVSKCNPDTDIKRDILQYCETAEELSNAEKYWINFYNSTNPEIGYNILKGGNAPSTEYRQKMSEIIHNKMSNEYRQKISQSLSKQRKTIGMSKAHKQHLSKALKGRNIGSDGDTRSIQVYCVVNYVKISFHSKVEAAKWWFDNFPFSEKYAETTYTRAITKSIKDKCAYKNIQWFLESTEILSTEPIYCIYKEQKFDFNNIKQAAKWWFENYPLTDKFDENLYTHKIRKSIQGFKILYKSVEYSNIQWYRKDT